MTAIPRVVFSGFGISRSRRRDRSPGRSSRRARPCPGRFVPPLPPGCFALEPLHVAAEALVHVVREFRPHVMTTYDENGGYPHPDHIMCHTVSMSAFAAAGDPTAYPHAGEPWQPLKIYYNQTFSRGRVVAFHEALTALGEESPYAAWLENWPPERERTVTTRSL